MGQQAFRHDLEIAKQCGESSPIQADDGIPRVDHIERNVAIEGIDHHLDGIADVAHAVFRRFGIRVAAGDGVGVLDPEQATPIDDDVGIRIELEEGSELADAFLHCPPELNAALRPDVVGDEDTDVVL